MNPIIQEDLQSIIYYKLIDWEIFRDKAFLITGATGMLPSYMALTLLELNRQKDFNIIINLLVRNKEKARNVFQEYLKDRNLKFIVQDVCDPIFLNDPINFIIHGASQASPKYYGIDPVGTARANIIGTDNLLRLAIEKKVESFLYFSSGGVYGNLESQDVMIQESMVGKIDPLNVRSCYFESKRMGENLCVDYNYQYGIPVKIIRIFHTLGPNIDIEDGRAFSDFCKNVIDGKNITLKSDGLAQRTFLYISDAIKAYFLVLLKGNNGEAYNIGSETQEVSMRDLAEELCDLYPEKRLKVKFDYDNSITYNRMKNPVNRIIPSVKKLKDLGWKEEIKYTDSFKRTIAAKL